MGGYVLHSVVRDQEVASESGLALAMKLIAEGRRSVRHFQEKIDSLPDAVVEGAIEIALQAPSMSNMQPWYFIRAKTPEVKEKLRAICLSQPAAMTASEFIVVCARTDRWKSYREKFIEFYDNLGVTLPKPFDSYYQKDVPYMYTVGFLNWFGFYKKISHFFLRLKMPFPVMCYTKKEMDFWAVKNTAFAMQNLLLAFYAYGYDSCPMNGFCPKRLKSLLGFNKDTHVLAVVAVGKRAREDAAFGPKVRFERELFYREI